MKLHTVFKIATVITLIICIFTLSACSTKGEELAGTVADINKINNSFYFKIDGIDGECIDTNHEKWINVLDFSTGVKCAKEGGIAEFKPFVFTHKVDTSTPYIQSAAVKHNRFKGAEFQVCRVVAGRQQQIFKITFNDFYIVNSEIGVLQDGTNVETVTCLAQKLVWWAAEVEDDNYINTYVECSYYGKIPAYSKSDEEPVIRHSLPVNSTANSRNEYFVKFDTFDGECRDNEHQKWIAALDYTLGGSSEIAQYGEFTSSEIQPLTFVHTVDTTTPKLQEGCMKYYPYSQVKFSYCKEIGGKKTDMLNALLQDAQIINADIYVDENGRLLESVSVLPKKMTLNAQLVKLDNSLGGRVETTYSAQQ